MTPWHETVKIAVGISTPLLHLCMMVRLFMSMVHKTGTAGSLQSDNETK